MDMRPDHLEDFCQLAAPIPSRDARRRSRQRLLQRARRQSIVPTSPQASLWQPLIWASVAWRWMLRLLNDESHYEYANQRRRLLRPFGEHALPMWGMYPFHYKSVCEI